MLTYIESRAINFISYSKIEVFGAHRLYRDMKAVVQIFLCSVMGRLAMNMDMCVNDGSTTLSSCQSNPNIRVEKIRGGKMDHIRSYKLSLYYQNIWWPTANNEKWIECKDLCDVCRSLPGIDDVDEGKNINLNFGYS